MNRYLRYLSRTADLEGCSKAARKDPSFGGAVILARIRSLELRHERAFVAFQNASVRGMIPDAGGWDIERIRQIFILVSWWRAAFLMDVPPELVPENMLRWQVPRQWREILPKSLMAMRKSDAAAARLHAGRPGAALSLLREVLVERRDAPSCEIAFYRLAAAIAVARLDHDPTPHLERAGRELLGGESLLRRARGSGILSALWEVLGDDRRADFWHERLWSLDVPAHTSSVFEARGRLIVEMARGEPAALAFV